MGIIVKPIITEKATLDTEKFNRYSFYVNPSANKIQIKEEIETVYGVDVLKVRTMIYAPKVKVKHTKAGLQVGKSNKMKKAIIDVAEGQEIDLFG